MGPDCKSCGKHPRTEHGLKDATTDPAIINDWWDRWPAANVGIVTGPESGFFALDIDRHGADGAATLAALESQYGPLPPTVEAITGGGGRHIPFRYPAGETIKSVPGKLGPGVDVKGLGGYLVAPPSRHASGRLYEWAPGRGPDEIALAEPAAWLLELLREPKGQERARHKQGQAEGTGGAKVEGGARNDTLTRLAGSLRARGAGEAAILASLLAYNENHCKPPLDADEVRGIARSIGSYPAGEQGLDLTELGNAQRLAARHGHDLRYCHPWRKWFVLGGTRWAEDTTGEVERRAKDTARSIYEEAARCPDNDKARKLGDWAKFSQSKYKLTAMVDLAKSEPDIPVKPEELDAAPWLLNVANGTIDLKTGELHPHRREDLLTKLAPVEFNPKAACPTWDRFLEEVFKGRRGLIDFVKRAVGYSLAGTVREHVLVICWGSGRNGKGTLVETIMGTLGDYAQTMRAESLLLTRGGGIPNDIAALKGARFVAASETGERCHLDEAKIKMLTGGDTLRARFLYSEEFQFSPSHQLWLATNHRPKITGTDKGIWSRIRLIPFEECFEGKEDTTLPVKLRAELPGILRWAVEGCLAWQNDGLGTSDEVRAASEGYRADMDVLGQFINDCCLQAPEAKVPTSELFQAYLRWAEGAGERKPLSKTDFGLRLAERDFVPSKSGSVRLWRGIGLMAGGGRLGHGTWQGRGIRQLS
jgi:putative DNA primase/helicase